jgi:hypothetical protein
VAPRFEHAANLIRPVDDKAESASARDLATEQRLQHPIVDPHAHGGR